MGKAQNNKLKVPRHVAIVLDGNRRFAKRLLLKPFMGHEWGARKVESLLNWCKDLGISEVTLYSLSLENFNRPKEEFDYLMNLFINEFTKFEDDPRIKENDLKVRFIGRTWLFPVKLQEIMKRLTDKTKDNNKFTVNFAMAYSGRAEIIDAVKKLANDIKENKISVDDLDEEIFNKKLYLASEPDLIIRTGGEKRMSGFLLWQGSYAEWIFLPNVLWPEFTKRHLVSCIKEYEKRERRFGK